MPLGKGYERQDCPIARALDVVGERWTLLVLRDCFFGVRRFGDLVAHLDVPRAVLTDRLATLVDAGILERSGREYLVTERAHLLWPALVALAAWGEQPHAAAGGTLRRFAHVACGSDLDPHGHCPACGTTPDPAALEVRPVRADDASGTRRDDPVSRALREPHRLLTPLP